MKTIHFLSVITIVFSSFLGSEANADQEHINTWDKVYLNESKIYSLAYLHNGCHILKHRNSDSITINVTKDDLNQRVVLLRSSLTGNMVIKEKIYYQNGYLSRRGTDIFYLQCLFWKKQ